MDRLQTTSYTYNFFDLLISNIIDIWTPGNENYINVFHIVTTIEEILENRDNYVGGKVSREIEGLQVSEMSMELLYYKND